jgi:hypothetical protein
VKQRNFLCLHHTEKNLTEYETKVSSSEKQKQIHLTEQSPDNEQERKYIIKTIEGDELINYCKKEISEVEKLLLDKFKDITKPEFNPRTLASDEYLERNHSHCLSLEKLKFNTQKH